MKYAATVALWLFGFVLSAFASPPHFEHIVIVIQENRTPDNLFGGNPSFEAGVNISTGQNAQAWGLDACFDPLHHHSDWEAQWNNGGTYQPCASAVDTSSCNPQPPANICLQKTFVPALDVDPYFQIARYYGFANFMFQTNEGPSFPAHHFLFSGTSVPYTSGVIGNYQTSQYFVSGNTPQGQASCTASPGSTAEDVGPDDVQSYAFTPPFITWGNAGYPCYDHQTLGDVLDHAGKTWHYYAWKKPYNIWNAPYSVYHLCQPNHPGSTGSCTGSHFTNGDVTITQGQILTDIGNCQLPNVSWVVPDGDWSDHPGSHATKNGPAWVASIVNKIGNNPTCANGDKYWNSTAIFITWDDWGGFYDHIPPYNVVRQVGTWGSGFVSGFRVPLLVVSAYTQDGTVSGGGVQTPNCTDPTVLYCHDFGSILKFIENNWGLPSVGLQDGLNYADDFAPDNKNSNVPLSEFFSLTSPKNFEPIAIPQGAPGESYFIGYTGEVPPDDD